MRDRRRCLDGAFPTHRRDTRAREQCARPARPEHASGGGRLDRVPRAREHGAHVRQAPPARRADGPAPQPCRAPRAPCVVVLINQVSTCANEVLGTSGLVPALGEAWAHMCNVQVSLEWRDDVRLAALSKGGEPGRRRLLSPPTASDLPTRAQSCWRRPGRLRRRWPAAALAGCRCCPLRRRAATALSSRCGARHEAGAQASELQLQRRREPAATAAAVLFRLF
jgi:hypothetical protein